MTPAAFFALMIVVFGALAGFLFLLASLRSKAFLSWRLLSFMTAAICLYCSALWGGAQLSWWAVTPELGRPALGLTLAALAWFGLLVPNASRKNAD